MRDTVNKNQITLEEIMRPSSSEINTSDIYEVTFGCLKGAAEYDDAVIYEDRVWVSDTRKLPVYAKLVDGKLKELFTDIEIPLPPWDTIPGFGAYKLQPIYRLYHYQNLLLYLQWIREVEDEYKKEFLFCKDYLDRKRTEYINESFGRHTETELLEIYYCNMENTKQELQKCLDELDTNKKF